MKIKQIRLKNFKCFEDVTVQLGQMNVLIGANASGKTNFLQAFKFVQDIQRFGLDDAIALQGGIDFLRNRITNAEKIDLEVVFDTKEHFLLQERNDKQQRISAISYFLQLNVTKDGFSKTEKIELEIAFLDKKTNKEIPIAKLTDRGNHLVTQATNKNFRILSKLGKMLVNDLTRAMSRYSKTGSLLMKKSENISFLTKYYYNPIFNYSLYNIIPNLAKKAISLKGKKSLEENGENLALVVQRILQDEEQRTQLLNLYQYLLPYIKNVAVDNFMGQHLLLKIEEENAGLMPASLLSDGTISIIALLVILFFEKPYAVILEEPAQGIHPGLIAKLMNVFYDAATHKQILISTHNPELLKHCKQEDLLLVQRHPKGSATISRPSEKASVQAFLENDLGLEELFVQNLLEI